MPYLIDITFPNQTVPNKKIEIKAFLLATVYIVCQNDMDQSLFFLFVHKATDSFTYIEQDACHACFVCQVSFNLRHLFSSAHSGSSGTAQANFGRRFKTYRPRVFLDA